MLGILKQTLKCALQTDKTCVRAKLLETGLRASTNLRYVNVDDIHLQGRAGRLYLPGVNVIQLIGENLRAPVVEIKFFGEEAEAVSIYDVSPDVVSIQYHVFKPSQLRVLKATVFVSKTLCLQFKAVQDSKGAVRGYIERSYGSVLWCSILAAYGHSYEVVWTALLRTMQLCHLLEQPCHRVNARHLVDIANVHLSTQAIQVLSLRVVLQLLDYDDTDRLLMLQAQIYSALKAHPYCSRMRSLGNEARQKIRLRISELKFKRAGPGVSLTGPSS